MRHVVVLALVLGVAGWASAVGSAQVLSCAPNSGVTVTQPIAVSGGLATVQFTVAPGCENTQLSLVSYQAPSGTFDQTTASQQVLYKVATPAVGATTLSVEIPACFFQV